MTNQFNEFTPEQLEAMQAEYDDLQEAMMNGCEQIEMHEHLENKHDQLEQKYKPTQKRKKTPAQKYKESNEHREGGYGLFGDREEPIDLGEWYPFEDRKHRDGYYHMNNISVKNIQSNG